MPRDERGFALVTTLWFLALLALVVVVIEGWITAALDRAHALRQETAATAALIGATDRVIFDLIVSGRSPRGLELAPPPAIANASAVAGSNLRWPPESPHIALDGGAYRVGGVVVRLQDEGGLYDLSNPKQGSLEKLLGSYGVSLSDADRLAAALLAYARKPSQLRGSEDTDADYARAGLPLPRHARLLTPWEPYRILGWARRPALWRGPNALADLVTTGPAGGLNVNAAPEAVLVAATGMDPGEAARVVAGRKAQPIANVNDLLRDPATSNRALDRELEVLPSSTVRLTLAAPNDPLAHIVSVRLTTQGPSPYRIDYSVALPQDAAVHADAASRLIPELPMALSAR